MDGLFCHCLGEGGGSSITVNSIIHSPLRKFPLHSQFVSIYIIVSVPGLLMWNPPPGGQAQKLTPPSRLHLQYIC